MKRLAFIVLLMLVAHAAHAQSFGPGLGGGSAGGTITTSGPGLSGVGSVGSPLVNTNPYTKYTFPQTYGGIADAKVVFNGTISNGSSTLTDTTDSPWVAGDVGKPICVGGISGVYGPTGSGAFSTVPQSELCGTIGSFTSSSSIGLTGITSANGGNVSNVTVRWGTDNCTALRATMAAVGVNGGRVALTGPFASTCSVVIPPTAPVYIEGIGSYAPDANNENSHFPALASGIWDLTTSLTTGGVVYGDLPILSITAAGTTATATLPYPGGPGFSSSTVTISGNSVSAFNGSSIAITKTSSTTFTYTVSSTTATGTGGLMAIANGYISQSMRGGLSDLQLIGGSGPTNCNAGSHCNGYFGTLAGGGSDGVQVNGDQRLELKNVDIENYKGDCLNIIGNSDEFVRADNNYWAYCGANGYEVSGTTWQSQDMILGSEIESMGLNGVYYHPANAAGNEYGDTFVVEGSTLQWNDVRNAATTYNINYASGRDATIFGNWLEGGNGGAGAACANSGGGAGTSSGGAGSQLWIGNHYPITATSCDNLQLLTSSDVTTTPPACTQAWEGSVQAVTNGAGTLATPAWTFGAIYSGGGTAYALITCDSSHWYYFGGGGGGAITSIVPGTNITCSPNSPACTGAVTINASSTGGITEAQHSSTISTATSYALQAQTITNEVFTFTAAATVTLPQGAAGNILNAYVCQNGTGGFTPTFTPIAGLTITGSFPTFTTTASLCGDFSLFYYSATQAYLSGSQPGPL